MNVHVKHVALALCALLALAAMLALVNEKRRAPRDHALPRSCYRCSIMGAPELGDRFFVTTRTFPGVTRARLFKAWTTANEIERWWGPRGFTNTFREFDARAGGRWVFTMHGPTGGRFENESAFREVTPDTRIVFDHVSQPRYTATIDFSDDADGARVRWRMEFETVERFEQVKKVAIPGNEENLDKLAAVLAEDAQ